MMKTKIVLGLASLLITGTVLADIIIVDRPPKKVKENVKEEAKEVTPIALKKGESKTVMLAENVTTGFQWEAEYDKALCSVDLEHRGAEWKKGEEPLCGAPGSVKVTMKLLTDKKAEVKLMYRRSWEKGIPPAETKIFVLTEKK